VNVFESIFLGEKLSISKVQFKNSFHCLVVPLLFFVLNLFVQTKLLSCPFEKIAGATPSFAVEDKSLTFRGKAILRLDSKAKFSNQVLTLFQEANWPSQVPNPFDPHDGLAERVVDALNHNQEKPRIRFSVSQDRKQIRWANNTLTPSYDLENRQLRLKGKIVKRFMLPSVAEETVLGAFENNQWASQIANPFYSQPNNTDRYEQARLAVAKLNRHQKTEGLMHFSLSSDGEQISWHRVEPQTNVATTFAHIPVHSSPKYNDSPTKKLVRVSHSETKLTSDELSKARSIESKVELNSVPSLPKEVLKEEVNSKATQAVSPYHEFKQRQNQEARNQISFNKNQILSRYEGHRTPDQITAFPIDKPRIEQVSGDATIWVPWAFTRIFENGEIVDELTTVEYVPYDPKATAQEIIERQLGVIIEPKGVDSLTSREIAIKRAQPLYMYDANRGDVTKNAKSAYGQDPRFINEIIENAKGNHQELLSRQIDATRFALSNYNRRENWDSSFYPSIEKVSKDNWDSTTYVRSYLIDSEGNKKLGGVFSFLTSGPDYMTRLPQNISGVPDVRRLPLENGNKMSFRLMKTLFQIFTIKEKSLRKTSLISV